MDVTRYVDGLRARERQIAAARQLRRTTLRARLPAMVRYLVDDLGAERVVLFGSLAGGLVHEHSDVDLAVAGVPPEMYWKALVQLSDLAGAPVDLVTLETAPPALLRRIAAAGEVLHG